MVFSAPLFIFFFLPVVLVVYHILPWRFKNLFLLASSLGFYFFGERLYSWVMLLIIAMNYSFGLLLLKGGSVRRKFIIGVCVALNLAVLAYFKYFNFFLSAFGDLLSFTGIVLPAPTAIHLPIGISFFTFQALSYTIDAYRNQIKIQTNPTDLALYVSLFPQLIAGPIVRYADVEKELGSRSHSLNEFAYGVERFVFGLAKKVLIANQIAYYVDKVFAIPDTELSTSLVWIAIIGYALQIYFDFSAYSDMAIGLGRMFGFKFLENFNHPYTALSIQDFWRRWHISLSTWFRDYLYIPLGGNRLSTFNTYRNLLIVFFLTGLWHGASYNFIIWGLLHGTFLILERVGFQRTLDRIPKFFRSLYVILIVLVGWVFFRAADLPQAFSFLTKMFIITGSLESKAHFEFLIDVNFLITLFLGAVFATPVRKKLFEDCFFINTNSPMSVKRWAYTILLGLTFLLSIVYLAAGTYNPFIYFRF